MTFFEWIRQCLLWDARQKALPEEQRTAVRERVIRDCSAQTGGGRLSFPQKGTSPGIDGRSTIRAAEEGDTGGKEWL